MIRRSAQNLKTFKIMWFVFFAGFLQAIRAYSRYNILPLFFSIYYTFSAFITYKYPQIFLYSVCPTLSGSPSESLYVCFPCGYFSNRPSVLHICQRPTFQSSNNAWTMPGSLYSSSKCLLFLISYFFKRYFPFLNITLSWLKYCMRTEQLVWLELYIKIIWL